jgi:hypothetical protein
MPEFLNGIELKPNSKAAPKSRNNPKPRAQRLTNAYVGIRADFDLSPAPITPELQRTIDHVLGMTDLERSQRYSGSLHLHAYTHEIYKFYATLRKSVVGFPIRRYFPDQKGAVTWLETVRERWQAGTIRHKIPLGGVSREEFRMVWQNETCGAGSGHFTATSAGRKGSRRSKGCRAEQHAEAAAKKRAKGAYHSVDPLKQKACVKGRADTAQILAGAYVPMPGNNVDTAAANGSTAATTKAP